MATEKVRDQKASHGRVWILEIKAWKITKYKDRRIRFIKPVVGQMAIKAPKDSELPSLFITEGQETVNRSKLDLV